MPDTSRPAWLGYVVAAAAAGGALLLRLVLHHTLGDSVRLLPFTAAVLVAGWYGGMVPGMAATGLGVLISLAPVWPPGAGYHVGHADDLVHLGLFVWLGALASWLCERLHRSGRRAARQADLLDRVSDPIVGWELGGGIFYWNRAAERLYGYPREEALGRVSHELLRAAAPVPLGEVLDALQRDGQWSGEMRHQARGGAAIVVSSRMALLREADGRRLVIETGRDVTEQRRAEEALRQSEERLRFLAESIPSIVWTAAPDGTILYVNRRWLEYTGLTQEENARGWAERVLHPDDYERCVREWSRALAEGSEYEVEVRNRRHDGAYRWFVTRATPFRDGEGRVVQWYGTTTDIEDQKQALAALREQEARFRQLADSIPQLAWMAWPDGHIYWYNQRWYDYTGTTLEEMEGWGWKGVHHPEHVERVVEGFQRSLDSGEAWEDTFPLRGKGGEYRWFLSRARPIRDAGGRVVRWFGTNTDVSEQRALEEALRAADRRKDEFLAVLAHELRNPLAPVRNAVAVLGLSGDEGARARALGMIERQMAHMARLIDDLMDVSRITRGKMRLRRGRVELAAVVREAVESARPLIDAHGHRLEVSLPAGPVWLDADADRLAQVFANLLTNAAKYTPDGGRVGLSAEAVAGGVEVRVKDTGVGIPAEALPRLFEMFSQVERSVGRSQGGLGIGLALVKGLVEMHGGTVEARSEGPGRGSELTVRLPTAGPAGSPVPETEAGENGGAGPGRRVLVVDDNKDSAESMATLLGLLGHDVRVAYDGRSAVEAAEGQRPELVLLDVGLPDISGHEVCRRIRERPWGAGVVLVAMTGWGQEEDRRRSREAGFDHHLVKPVDPQHLRDLLAGPGAVG